MGLQAQRRVMDIDKKMIFLGLAAAIIVVVVVVVLYHTGRIRPNETFASRYPIQGMDVSNHQDEIDWQQIDQNAEISFVFLKATEGKNYRDQYFQKNWEELSGAGIYKGAYHYFTLTSSGREQAENFIAVVPVESGCLPPVIDIEEYGLDQETFRKELRDFIYLVEERYQQKPILYVIYSLYDEYIKGEFEENPIWISDIVKAPKLSDQREWLFWQYSHNGKVNGVPGDVDLDVFQGDRRQLEALLSK
ncbi:MAG: hypothetical protein LBT32_08155 [Peptococcaceae bacterium]|jgi:lysozyme|nr:hypothetical protein [Peptococcaceae bacterium]